MMATFCLTALVSIATQPAFAWKLTPEGETLHGAGFLQHFRAPPGQMCQRKCAHYANRIIYDDTGKGGINDKFSVLWGMSNLAEYLCATLETQRPYVSLHSKHNHGSPVSKNMHWADYFIIESANPARVGDAKSRLVLKEEDSLKLSSRTRRQFQSNSTESLLQTFQDIYLYTEEQEQTAQQGNLPPYDWKLTETTYYSFRDNLCKHFKHELTGNPRLRGQHPNHICVKRLQGSIPSCEYVKITNPQFVSQASSAILRGDFGYFHIRRGDATGRCLTSPTKINQYLNCSLHNLNTGPLTFAFSSDEVNQTYRAEIRKIVESYGHFVDLDKAVKQHLDQQVKLHKLQADRVSNYMIYTIIKDISTRARFKLTQSWTSCPDCDRNRLVDAFGLDSASSLNRHDHV